jgi:hypothetical protein
MSATSREASIGGGLRERHAVQTTTSQINPENSTDRMDERLNGHVEKEKKTFGRTPGGTGKQYNPCYARLLSIEGNSMPLFSCCPLSTDAYYL